MKSKEIFSPYATVALVAKKELQNVEQKLETESDSRSISILKKQRSGLKHLIDRCFRLTGDFLPAHVSVCAQKYCSDKNLGAIFEIGWDGQKKFENQANRKNCKLKHEHKIPVAELVKKMHEAETLNDAINIFENQEIVWVLKDEDRKLPKSKRPDSGREYEKAGIKIIKNSNPIGHRFK